MLIIVLCSPFARMQGVVPGLGSGDEAAASVVSDAAAALSVECPTLSGLESGQRAVRELVDRVHVGEDRAIVRHHEGALVLGLHFLADQLSDLLTTIRVKARGRLVCQDQLGVADEGARDRRALLLTARHLAWVLGVAGLDSHVLHEGVDLGLPRGLVLFALELGDQLELIPIWIGYGLLDRL